jgi:NAD(P)-dependent dehydrogenase (short-subunit alcohol dehydrogenase family)
MTLDLTGKTAVVTGSTKGIGYAIAEGLARANANVVVCARKQAEVERAVVALGDAGAGRVIGQVCDVGEYEQVKALIERAVGEFGGLDVLVNNAGVGAYSPMDEMAVDVWRSILRTNLDGAFYASREAIPHLKRRGGGWIINIGSLAGKNPMPGGAAYNASKFGLLGFSEAMMLDVRHYGIRVSCVMPGSVATHFNEHTPNEADAWKIQPEDLADLVMDLLATPERTLPSRIEVRPTKPPRK